jgi:hypothetical protein
MPLECAVLRDNGFGLHDEIGERRGVSLQCFAGNQMLFAVIIHEAVEDRYGVRSITREEGNRLVDGDLDAIGSLITTKLQAGEILRLHPVGQRAYPLILVTMQDMQDTSRITPYVSPAPMAVGGFRFVKA